MSGSFSAGYSIRGRASATEEEQRRRRHRRQSGKGKGNCERASYSSTPGNFRFSYDTCTTRRITQHISKAIAICQPPSLSVITTISTEPHRLQWCTTAPACDKHLSRADDKFGQSVTHVAANEPANLVPVSFSDSAFVWIPASGQHGSPSVATCCTARHVVVATTTYAKWHCSRRSCTAPSTVHQRAFCIRRPVAIACFWYPSTGRQ